MKNILLIKIVFAPEITKESLGRMQKIWKTGQKWVWKSTWWWQFKENEGIWSLACCSDGPRWRWRSQETCHGDLNVEWQEGCECHQDTMGPRSQCPLGEEQSQETRSLIQLQAPSPESFLPVLVYLFNSSIGSGISPSLFPNSLPCTDFPHIITLV